jgi:homoserine O-acetyltransferase
MNVPGSCYGSTGPWTPRADNGKPWKADFPAITIRDMVRFQQLLLDAWDIQNIEFVIGGSMGGMQALEFAVMDSRVQRVIPIAIGKSHTPWAIGINHTQRQAIFRDPAWKDGYYEKGKGPENGLAVARMIAMISYRSPSDYQQKFGRSLQPESTQFQIESYLNYQGDKLVKRFDALSYIRLSQAMDTHDIARGRESYKEVLGQVTQPALVIGIDSDQLYPVSEQRELAKLMNNGHYKELSSPHGHDAFLIDFDGLNQCIVPFLEHSKESQNV